MFIEKLAQFWSVSNPLPWRVDLIALASFGATKDGLTKGAQATMRKALELAALHPEARVAFGVFTLSPRPGLEEAIKRQFFKDPIFAGDVVSTIEESEKIRSVLPSGFNPLTIVVVTDEWHSRSAKTVWKRIWKDRNPDIRVITVPSSETVGPENPMTPLRKQWKWALWNVLRHTFLVCFPKSSIRWMKKLNLHSPVG